MIRGHIRCTLYEILPPDAFLNAKNPVDMHDFVIVYFDQQKASSYQFNHALSDCAHLISPFDVGYVCLEKIGIERSMRYGLNCKIKKQRRSTASIATA